ncbi:hypothetical protein AMTR_s00002p00271800, partial [Amborella trichopoda]
MVVDELGTLTDSWESLLGCSGFVDGRYGVVARVPLWMGYVFEKVRKLGYAVGMVFYGFAVWGVFVTWQHLEVVMMWLSDCYNHKFAPQTFLVSLAMSAVPFLEYRSPFL